MFKCIIEINPSMFGLRVQLETDGFKFINDTVHAYRALSLDLSVKAAGGS